MVEKLKKCRAFGSSPAFPLLPLAEWDDPAETEEELLESADAFSTDPISFEELTAVLLEETEEMFAVTRTANRRSRFYYEVSRSLEKMLRELGSCCVTKAVLEKKNCSFPALTGLTVEKLYGMLSFNVRKCHASNRELREMNQVPDNGPEMIARWYVLAERLTATAARIEKIHAGKLDPDKLLEEPVIRIRKLNMEEGERKEFPPRPEKPASLPLNKPAARQELQARAEAGKPAEAQIQDPQTEKRREILIREALIRDGEDYAAMLRTAAKDVVDEAWVEYMRSSAPLIRSGQNIPPPETRKKLREKRKKRK